MKKILTKNILLLCFLFSIERFAYYSLRSSIALYLIRFLELSDTDAFRIYGNITLFTPIGYILTAILIDRIPLFKNFKLFFILIGIGAAVLFFPGTIYLYTGVTIILVTGIFIKVNVFIKIYENLPDEYARYDNMFILLYLISNLFGFAAPLLSPLLRDIIGFRFALPLLVIIPLIIYIPIFLIAYDAKNEVKNKFSIQSLKNKKLFIIIAGCIVVLGFFNVNEPYNFEFKNNLPGNLILLQNSISMIFYFIIGLFSLLIINVPLQLKKISISIILLIAIAVLFIISRTLETNSLLIICIIQAIKGSIDILLYPVIVSIILLLSRPDKRGTTLSIFFLALSILGSASNYMTFMDNNMILIGSIIILIILVFLYVLHSRNSELAAHNNQYKS